MRLLYTLTAYPPLIGGAQFHQHLLALRLKDQHEIQVVCHWNSKETRTDWLLGTTLLAPRQSADCSTDGIDVHRLGLSMSEKIRIAPYVPIYYPLMAVALPPIANCLEHHLLPHAANSDLVHNVRIGREALSYASFQAARRRDVPFVITPVHHPRWVGWRQSAYNKLYRMADLVIALTESEKRTLCSLGVREERITVTGMGPIVAPTSAPEAFLSRHQIDGPVVLFLGQHYPYKGYRELLRAARRIWKLVPETHFVFIGPQIGQSQRELRAFEDTRIHPLGRVALQEKTDALAACTVLCVPSTQESFGAVYTEAWHFAKPVIGCKIPAVEEVVSDGEDGFLVNQNPAEIADRVCYLLLHSDDCRAMGLAGQKKQLSRYTWIHIKDRTERAYRKVITRSSQEAEVRI